MILSRFGKMPTTSVRRRISRLSLLRVVAPNLAPVFFWKSGKGEQLLSLGQHLRRVAEALQLLDGTGVLGTYRLGIGLSKNRPYKRRDQAVRLLRYLGQQRLGRSYSVGTT
jgi:hypothetical protein